MKNIKRFMIIALILLVLNITISIVLQNIVLNYISLVLITSLIFLFFRHSKKADIIIVNKDVEIRSLENSIKNLKTKLDKLESSRIKNLDTKGEVRPKSCVGCTEEVYFIQESLPIMKDLTVNTKKVEEESINSLFMLFSEISNETSDIVKESENSLSSIFNSNNSKNLTYLLNSSRDIKSVFIDYLNKINGMSVLTEKFINTSINSFNTIMKTTKDIIDLAEQVKVISINVRIEAARIKDSGGFKVLGNDISNFADKTSQVVTDTHKAIEDTISEITKQKIDLLDNLKGVEESANNIFNKVDPFESIILESTTSVKDIVTNINNITTNLQSRLNDAISSMQYQDISSQQIDHILDFIHRIGESKLMDRDFDIYLNSSRKDSIKSEILGFLKDRITTRDEEIEVEKYANKWGIKLTEKVDSDKSHNITLF